MNVKQRKSSVDNEGSPSCSSVNATFGLELAKNKAAAFVHVLLIPWSQPALAGQHEAVSPARLLCFDN